jgi:hypothetical protein
MKCGYGTNIFLGDTPIEKDKWMAVPPNLQPLIGSIILIL